MALLKDHLIAHYKMNDNAATAVVIDSSGNGHTGEYQLNSVAQNTNTSDETGKILRALDFVGGVNGEMIVVPDHADFSPGAGVPGSGTPLSISAWVYMHNVLDFALTSKGVYNIDAEWRFRTLGGGELEFILFDESVDNCFIGRKYDTSLATYVNQWIHIVGTYDGGILNSGIKIYLNAVRKDDTDREGSPGFFVAAEPSGHNVWIGRRSTSYADGLIDNIMFFNKDLTLLEVQYLYNSGAGVESIPTLIELSRTGHSFSSRQEI